MVQGGGLAEAVEVADLVRTVKLNHLKTFDPCWLHPSLHNLLVGFILHHLDEYNMFFVILCPRDVRLIKSRSIENQVETNLHLFERLDNVLI